MKRFIASFGWLMLLLPIISVAGTRSLINTIKAESISNENRQVSGFSGVASSGSFDVIINISGTENLKLEGDADDLAKVETVVENGILKIRSKREYKNSWNGFRSKVKVYIMAKQLNSLAVSGSGNMKVEGLIKTQTLNVKVSGSGDIKFDANVAKLNLALSGSGGISSSGYATDVVIAVSGSGDFDGKNLRTKTASVKVSGSGEATIIADDNLNAALSGSGNIYYSGHAKVYVSKSGSGQVKKM